MEEMSREKQIDEMAKDIKRLDEVPYIPNSTYNFRRASKLYSMGYRKQRGKDSSKGCEYCKGRAYTKKPLTVITKYGRRIELVFEFCPNCGRKMKGGAE